MTVGIWELQPCPPRGTGPWEPAGATDAPGRRASATAEASGEPRPHTQVFTLKFAAVEIIKKNPLLTPLLTHRVAFVLLQGAFSPLLASPCRTGQTWDRHATPATPASSATTPWRSVRVSFSSFTLFSFSPFCLFSPFVFITQSQFLSFLSFFLFF